MLPPDPRSHYKVELVKQLLLEIERTTREAGALFAVALAPFAAQTGEADLQNPLHTELVRFLTHAGIQVVDLLPMLRASGLANAALYADSMHFSPEGNRVVAELLASALQNPTE